MFYIPDFIVQEQNDGYVVTHPEGGINSNGNINDSGKYNNQCKCKINLGRICQLFKEYVQNIILVDHITFRKNVRTILHAERTEIKTYRNNKKR